MFNFIRIHKIISAIVAANLLAIIIIAIMFIIHISKTATIDIKVVPTTATIKLNGQTYENNVSQNLIPGKYVAEISMEGMQTKTVEMDLATDDFYKLQVYLLDSNSTFNYYETHPSEVDALEQLESNDEALKKFVDRYNKIYSIVDQLPLQLYNRTDDPATTWGVYVDQYGTSTSNELENTEDNLASKCPTIVCLEAYVSNASNDIVYDLIREAGYNPDDYQITFGESE
ncbi:hypothetical protein IKF33_03320 [Candidatus Saccharibacteria bacterium]|nr:hypothetical protein [Candidatus Saccharibacteria bacterium]